MSVLLLQLVGPMQSWGVQSRFSIRDTGLEPSKSGIVGLLCAALGRPRATPVDDLAALRMGVRVDREGRMEKDFHTTMNVLKAAGKGLFPTVLSTRFYLADAAFLVGLEGDLELLRKLDRALADPVWSLFLGRKAFLPSMPVRLNDGIQEGENLEEALHGYQRIATGRQEDETTRLRLVMESPNGETVRVDQPLSFAARHFTQRRVTTLWIPTAELPAGKEE